MSLCLFFLSMLTHLRISFSPMGFNINMLMTSSLAQTYLTYSHKVLICMINNQLNISNQVFNSQFKFSMFKTKVEYFLQTLSSCNQLIAILSFQFLRQKLDSFFSDTPHPIYHKILLNFTFKIYTESSYFSPSLLISPWFKSLHLLFVLLTQSQN